jgi:hypothetical protein
MEITESLLRNLIIYISLWLKKNKLKTKPIEIN